MVSLIITEKPQTSLKIAQALSDSKIEKNLYKRIPYYIITHKNKKIVVACAVGHLYNLTEKNKSQDYPIFDLEWQESYKISKSSAFTKSYLDLIKQLSKKADEFYIATDKDLEGELIGYNVLRFACNKKDAKRMEFSTLTKQDLIEAFENSKQHLDLKLAESGETRHFADFYWGLTSSKALISSIKKAGQFKILSSGRVQSPTLTLLSHKELEIQKFKPEDYWQLFAHIDAIKALHEKDKFWEETEVKNIEKKCKNKKALVKQIKKKEYNVLPLPPFNITSLQTEAYKLFKFSPKQTLDIAQQLYLSAYISYPRTSSEKLNPNIDYKKIITSLSKFKEFSKISKELLTKSLNPIQGKKIDPAHIAIYPTSSPPESLSSFNPQQKKLYILIIQRFLSCFSDPAIRKSLEIKFDINKETFIAKGVKTLEKGWLDIYPAKFKEIEIPELQENKEYPVKKLEVIQDQTKPPQRYSQGSIIAEMEKRGLGTRATRSSILQTLYDRDYIKEKSIQVTNLGLSVSKTLEKYVPDLISEQLTRHFEKEMEQIQEGKKKKEQVLEEAKEILIKISKEFKKNEEKIGKELLKATRETQKQESIIGNCPNCSSDLVIKRSKYGFFAACSGYPKCKTTFSLPPNALIKPTNETCKDCKFPVVLVIRKGKRPFKYCLSKECPAKLKWLEQMNKNNNSSHF